MHNFSNLFDKILYMFQTGPLSIIRSISTLYTCNRYWSTYKFHQIPAEGLCVGVWVFVKLLPQQYVRCHTAFSSFCE